MKRSNLRLLSMLSLSVVAASAACAAPSEEDEAAGNDEAIIADYTTPDPNNLWTKDVDLREMKIGEENVLPNEEQMFDGFAGDIQDMQDRLAGLNGGKARGFHAKAHACVLGELRVNVPASLGKAKVGLFAQNRSYPAWIRYSNGTGFVQADKKGDVRGVAIKVMKVPGKKLLPGGEDAVTQDFLMTNGATTPAPDSRQFVAFGKALTDARVRPDGEEIGAIEGMLKTGGYLLKSENKRVREYLLSKALPRVLSRGSVLAEQFWTGGAFAMGVEDGDPMRAPAKQAAKMTAIPGVLRDGRCQTVHDLPNFFDKDYFRTDITKRMKNDETCLDLEIQFQADPVKQPIEDSSVEWRERDAPFVSIGYVYIPKTDLNDASTQRRESFCNGLGFTPWHALREHRPLGNIMRARRPVYEASRTNRGGAGEPTGDEQP